MNSLKKRKYLLVQFFNLEKIENIYLYAFHNHLDEHSSKRISLSYDISKNF